MVFPAIRKDGMYVAGKEKVVTDAELRPSFLVPVVHIKDGKATTNSRDVAAFFGKSHCHVLRDIDDIASKLGSNEDGWFQPTSYETKVGFGTRKWPAVDMTRDGFMLLVMGYTDPRNLPGLRPEEVCYPFRVP